MAFSIAICIPCSRFTRTDSFFFEKLKYGILNLEFLFDCVEMRPSVSCNAERRKILLAPDKARDVHNDIIFERPRRAKLGYQIAMQFLKLGSTFTGENSGC